LSTERIHHASKRRRYTLVLVPDEDAAGAKSASFAVWHFVAIAAAFIICVAVVFGALFAYTPLGQLIPMTSSVWRNQYSRELVDLNKRMTSMMEELVELRVYNIKLRKVLGEKVPSADSQAVASSENAGEHVSSANNIEQRNVVLPGENQFEEDMPAIPVRTDLKLTEVPLQFPAIFPTQGYITRGYDPHINHYGIDIAGKMGSLVFAAAEGVVLFAGWTSADGNFIIIAHSGGFITCYKHNRTILKSAGMKVKRGEAIATLGDSGETSRGPHLHFEIWKDGKSVDPSMFLIHYNI
jgi:murein DD-endopeptidase MepM/ murein hydrolase activator NlpD